MQSPNNFRCISLALACAWLTACHSSGAGGGVIEITLISTDKDRSEYGVTEKSQWKMVAVDGDLRRGNFVVWLARDMKSSDASHEEISMAFLKEGAGTIQSASYRSIGSEPAVFGPWRIVGTSPLTDAELREK